jgi:hypothetical protein
VATAFSTATTMAATPPFMSEAPATVLTVAADVAAENVAAPAPVPGGDGVQVPGHHQRLRRCVAARQPGQKVRSARREGDHLGGDALAVQPRRELPGNHLVTAGRVDGVGPHQLLGQRHFARQRDSDVSGADVRHGTLLG